ncbi:putative aminopeptidase npepl1, partial [Cladochytrium tenue]
MAAPTLAVSFASDAAALTSLVQGKKYVLVLGEASDLVPRAPAAAKPLLATLLAALSLPPPAIAFAPLSATENDGGPAPESSITLFAPPPAVGAGSVALTVTTLPSERSRHLGGIRGDLVHEAAGKLAAKSGDVLVVVLLRDYDQALHAACAVGRAFPTFSRKTGKSDSAARAKQVDLCLAVPDGATGVPPSVTELSEVVDCVRQAAHLVDAPPNELHTDSYVDRVARLHEEKLRPLGVEMVAIRGEELRQRGYGAIYAVGRAAEHPPALVILSYKPTSSPVTTMAWVGKGIVYDSGGLSIKPTTSMTTMKTDMGGSAGVLYGFVAAVTTNAAKDMHLHAILCIAENSVDERSTRNDDILTSYSGKTIEVNNTDAEGRLVLADGVAHACKHLAPDVIIDMATLTGAQSYATGLRHAGVLSNHAAFEADVVRAGARCGDLAFPLIYCPELHGVKKHFA